MLNFYLIWAFVLIFAYIFFSPFFEDARKKKENLSHLNPQLLTPHSVIVGTLK